MGCKTHDQHAHKHGANCGHVGIMHEGHTDYLHDGHLHHDHGDHIDEHVLATDASKCTPEHACESHAPAHVHSAKCGHEAIPHGDHTDYLVEGHLHHPCAGHCDDHGSLQVIK